MLNYCIDDPIYKQGTPSARRAFPALIFGGNTMMRNMMKNLVLSMTNVGKQLNVIGQL